MTSAHLLLRPDASHGWVLSEASRLLDHSEQFVPRL